MIIGVVVVVIGFMSWVFKTAPRNPSPRRWNEKKCSARESELELKSKPFEDGLKYAVVGVGQVGRRILEALCFREREIRSRSTRSTTIGYVLPVSILHSSKVIFEILKL